jgi:hypothetical protein
MRTVRNLSLVVEDVEVVLRDAQHANAGWLPRGSPRRVSGSGTAGRGRTRLLEQSRERALLRRAAFDKKNSLSSRSGAACGASSAQAVEEHHGPSGWRIHQCAPARAMSRGTSRHGDHVRGAARRRLRGTMAKPLAASPAVEALARRAR